MDLEMKGVGRGREAIRGDGKRRHREKGGRQRDSCLTVTSCFSIYLIWYKLLGGLFSYELECYSIWFLCIYPHELFVLMNVPNSTAASSTLHDLPFWRPRTEI